MTNEENVRKAVRKEIKQTIKEDNIAVDLVNWLTKKMGIAVEKRAMKKLAKDKVLQSALKQMRDRVEKYDYTDNLDRIRKISGF
tara:strand:+ start:910 stop:1161 length:252 start_codon:yes stop_codon:yes gene_type:complete